MTYIVLKAPLNSNQPTNQAHDATTFLSVSCLPSGGMDAEVHLIETSSATTRSHVELGLPEVASRTMVASALQHVQHNDDLRLGALVQRGRRSAVCWLALCHLPDLRICRMLSVRNADDLP